MFTEFLRVTDKLDCVRSVFERWLVINKEYIERYKSSTDSEYTDCLYWYNERANVGALASAAWLSGGVALEEYSSDKEDEKSGQFQGRRDLYFDYDGHCILCEAKIKWLDPGDVDKQVREIGDEMEEAVKATRQSCKGETWASIGLALVFVVPRSNRFEGGGAEKRDLAKDSAWIERLLATLQATRDLRGNGERNHTCDLLASLQTKDMPIRSKKTGREYNQVILIGSVACEDCRKD